MRLQENSRVGIVGGGPAGCFAAIHLLDHARRAGLPLDVRIYDPRFSAETGAAVGCKGCAGIVSANALQAIQSLGLKIPPAVIQETIAEYRVHIIGQILRLRQPRPNRTILSVYRGCGPRLNSPGPIDSLDAFLLAAAKDRGAIHIAERVTSVEWRAGPVLRSASGEFPVDLVIVANGVNSRPVLAPAFDYSQPPLEVMAQDEIRKPADWPAHTVAAFFGDPKGLVFGALIPKRDFLNVSLLGRGMGSDPIHEFFRVQRKPLSQYLVPEPECCCGCSPRVPVHAARRFYGDRWVAVGDAAVARLYKDGIFSAFTTAGRAMETAVTIGIGSADFQAGYAPAARAIAADNQYGDILFRISNAIVKTPRLAGAFLYSLRQDEMRPPEKKILARLIWGMLTGDESYRDLFRMSFRPSDLAALGRDALRREWEAARRGDRRP
jgi:flavin-dependent dehydrogenase